MNIQLAGYNTDIQNGGNTPETLSASYARISRDPRPINVLRKEAAAEVEKARASNRCIIFDYGHGSVAEHAVFNFDILDVSRLAAEELQGFRLASFTEKSQRYIRIGEDLVVPSELRGDVKGDYREAALKLFQLYNRIYDGLRSSGLKKDKAKEDARYVLPLATACQMGMTVNARELELMVRRLSCHPFAEVRLIADRLLELAVEAAPSLFLFLEPTAMDMFAHSLSPVESRPSDCVVLLDCDDDSKVGSLLIQWSSGRSLESALKMWLELDGQSREELFVEALSGLGIHDSLPRIWEFFRAGFQLVLSATAFAQLKRHRMCSRLVSVYDPILGATVPASISDAGLEEDFMQGLHEAERTAGTLGKLYPYMLTNAHRRRVVLSMNGRELYHFSRLREDVHAQWDIREIAHIMMSSLREKAPLTFMLAGGKSEVSDLF
ncbi:MAG: FAD-dependent thymidylate synthase [Candidatus Aegiribacteria sp.]|nr:FAD-dependent thymidylate synthase [Candidatus Aegiribacteria sp.]